VGFFLNSKFVLSDGEPSNIGYHYQNGLTRESQVWPGLTGHSLISFQPTFESATTAAGNKGKNQISLKKSISNFVTYAFEKNSLVLLR
jgi:hypothetical protein